MEGFFIVGGNRLGGEVKIDCAKNAILPIIACCSLINDEVELKNIPRYSDVLVMGEIIKQLGGKADFSGNDLLIDCRKLSENCVSSELTNQVRSSIFMLGPMIARLKSAVVAYPGGCDIGLRPIDLHLKGLRELGAKIVEKNGYIYADGANLKAADLMLTFPSVGATENLLMLASGIEGTSRIFGGAQEPEIDDLIAFICACGGDVKRNGGVIVVNGGGKLHGCSFQPIPDRIETGTYMIATAMCGGEIAIKNAIESHNSALISKLSKTSCKIECKGDTIIVKGDGKPQGFGEVETAVYPGFPTDLQAQMTALGAVSEGYSLILENVFEARNKHIGELLKMGCDIRTRNGITIIKGREKLYGADVKATDLRGGAALVLAGLKAEGYTTISNVKLIDRGYYKMEEKLRALGCDIQRIEID